MNSSNNTKQFVAKIFIEESRKIHGDKYDYSLVADNHRKSYLKVNIKCPIHGVFTQEAGYHLKGSGCPHCGRLKVRQSIRKYFAASTFVEAARTIHGDVYDYSLVRDSPTSTHLKVDLICRLHGKFSVAAKDHIGKRGGRCPRCSKKESYGEFLIRRCLIDNKIDFEVQKKFDSLVDPISKRKLSYDFFLQKHNTLIEFDGEYHSFPPNFKKMDASELDEVRRKIELRDDIKTEFAKLNGIKLLRISYEHRNPNSILKILRDFGIISD